MVAGITYTVACKTCISDIGKEQKYSKYTALDEFNCSYSDLLIRMINTPSISVQFRTKGKAKKF